MAPSFAPLATASFALGLLLLIVFRITAGPDQNPVRRTARQVYIDLGANWANTLRLYQDIAPNDRSRPWEVYAFEASPLIQPYVEKFVDYLDGRAPRPPLTVPPSGSTSHLREYAASYGCREARDTSDDAMRACMWEVFKEPLSHLAPNPELNNSLLVRERLALAAYPARADRFVFVPSAASSFFGVLDLGEVSAQQMIRGGALTKGGNMTYVARVQSANVAAWMLEHFALEDYLVVKMDIEGAEFDILAEIFAASPCLIDLLAIECHWGLGDCGGLFRTLKQYKCTKVLVEGGATEVGITTPGPATIIP